jgi:DNA-binding NarL/FixJ family response regulator
MNQTPTTPPPLDNSPQPLRTLVVDDSFRFLKALCAYLKTEPLFQVVGTATGGDEALHMAELLGADLVLMDLHMPVMDGLQATAILRRRVPSIQIIIMTLDDSATAEAMARAHGAHGYIWKLRIKDDLLAEVRQVWQWKEFLTKTLTGLSPIISQPAGLPGSGEMSSSPSPMTRKGIQMREHVIDISTEVFHVVQQQTPGYVSWGEEKPGPTQKILVEEDVYTEFIDRAIAHRQTLDQVICEACTRTVQ